MAKKSRVWDGTAWQELASAQTDLTAYSTTAQMNTAITAGVGLVPILTQTIGTAVSSVVVSNAFSTTYENYKIVVSGGVGSTTNYLTLKIGGASGHYAGGAAFNYSTGASGTTITNNLAQWNYVGILRTTGIVANVEIISPFLTVNTHMAAFNYNDATAGGLISGYLNDIVSYTGFTLAPASGTLTGGTIKVYGYKN